MKLYRLLKTALDETRMQMLCAEVLFGFQFGSAFQSEFDRLSPLARGADVLALMLIVLTIGLLVTAPSMHRLLEQGEATARLYRATRLLALAALAPMMLALACDFFIVTDFMFGRADGWTAAALVLLLSAGAWYGAALVLSRIVPAREPTMSIVTDEATPLHAKVEQMLTEARVILPGAQALLGFQFIVILTQAFSDLPEAARLTHFVALCAVALALVLLVTPAAIHRLTFKGQDSERFHAIGSWIVTAALVPLAIGIACDVYVATVKMLADPALALTLAISAFVLLIGLWYVLPFVIAAVWSESSRSPARR
jgi:hypothetical protein